CTSYYYINFPQPPSIPFFLFLPATPPTDIYTLSLHDALPIFHRRRPCGRNRRSRPRRRRSPLRPRRRSHPDGRSRAPAVRVATRSEEHTSELQSPYDLVCRLLLEKKKKQKSNISPRYT